MNEHVEKIKSHFKKNEIVYKSVGASICVAAFTSVIMRDISTPSISRGIPVTASRGIPVTGKSFVTNNVSHSVFGKSQVLNTVSYISADRKGAPSWVVRCIETGTIFNSQREAAASMGLSASEISRHLKGTIDHVRGFTFERICMAA